MCIPPIVYCTNNLSWNELIKKMRSQKKIDHLISQTKRTDKLSFITFFFLSLWRHRCDTVSVCWDIRRGDASEAVASALREGAAMTDRVVHRDGQVYPYPNKIMCRARFGS